MKKVAFLTNMLPPYRMEFYAALAQHCKLLVVSDVAMESNRQWDVDTSNLPFQLVIPESYHFEYSYKRDDLGYERKKVFHFSHHTLKALADFGPDIVVSLEMGFRTIQSLAYCRWAGIPLQIYWEGTHVTSANISGLKQRIRKWISKSASRIWVNGKDAAAYLIDLGVDRKKLDLGMTGVSTQKHHDEVLRQMPGREDERHKLGLKGTTLLFTGVLNRRKGLHLLMQSIDSILASGANTNFSLLVVGSGEMENELREWAAGHDEIPIVITGFVNPSEIHQYYAMGDIFVMPTLDDCWPLVTLEAFVSGLPQLFSIRNGATADLYKSSRSGESIDPLDPQAFVAALRKLIKQPPARLTADEIRPVMEFYSPEMQADRAWKSITASLDNPPSKKHN